MYARSSVRCLALGVGASVRTVSVGIWLACRAARAGDIFRMRAPTPGHRAASKRVWQRELARILSLNSLRPPLELVRPGAGVASEANRFGRCLNINAVSMYGGAPKRDQMYKYRAGVHMIVACPGRLNDFLEGGQVRLDAVKTLVLDEARGRVCCSRLVGWWRQQGRT